MNQPFYLSKQKEIEITLDLKSRFEDHSNTDIINRLSKFYQNMLIAQEQVEEVWKPAGEWKNYNDEKRFLYSSLVKGQIEITGDILNNFWRNKLGLIVKEYATFENLQKGNPEVLNPFLSSILRNYIIWKDIYGLPEKRLEIVAQVGNPWGCIIDDILVTPKATRYHHNAMQIINLLKASKGKVVAEIGAGYGALCHYLQKENCGATYIDFDLPETIILAAYHLVNAFPEKKIYLFGEGELSTEDILAYDIILLPNFVLPNFREKSFDVFFNSFSLSEMPFEANERYLLEIARTTSGYFLHNNMDREGVINRGFNRIPASKYPIDNDKYTLLSKSYDLFHGHNGDYKEFLYKVN